MGRIHFYCVYLYYERNFLSHKADSRRFLKDIINKNLDIWSVNNRWTKEKYSWYKYN